VPDVGQAGLDAQVQVVANLHSTAQRAHSVQIMGTPSGPLLAEVRIGVLAGMQNMPQNQTMPTAGGSSMPVAGLTFLTHQPAHMSAADNTQWQQMSVQGQMHECCDVKSPMPQVRHATGAVAH
jgi:hypothetical protein